MTEQPAAHGLPTTAAARTGVDSGRLAALRVFRVGEKQFQSDVVALARTLGYRVQFDAATNAPRSCPACSSLIRLPRNPRDWPDLMLLRPGSRDRGPRFIVAELKADNGVVRPGQVAVLQLLWECGVECYVWRWSPGIMQTIADVLA